MADTLSLDTPQGRVRAWHLTVSEADDTFRHLLLAPGVVAETEWFPPGGGGDLWDFCTGDSTPDLNGDGTDDVGFAVSGYVHGVDVEVWLSSPQGYVRAEAALANPCTVGNGVLVSEAFWKGGGSSLGRYAVRGQALREISRVAYGSAEDTLAADGAPLAIEWRHRGESTTKRHISYGEVPSRARWWDDDWAEEVEALERDKAVYTLRDRCRNAARYTFVAARTLGARLGPSHGRDACAVLDSRGIERRAPR